MQHCDCMFKYLCSAVAIADMHVKTTEILLICLSICYGLQASPTDGICQIRYKDLLSQAVSLQSDCGEPELYDCCAVSIYRDCQRYMQTLRRLTMKAVHLAPCRLLVWSRTMFCRIVIEHFVQCCVKLNM